jgi:hypothetical protein
MGVSGDWPTAPSPVDQYPDIFTEPLNAWPPNDTMNSDSGYPDMKSVPLNTYPDEGPMNQDSSYPDHR